MNKFSLPILCAAILACTFSCSNSDKNEDSAVVVEQTLKNEASFEAEIKAIDEEIAVSGKLLSSMRFTKENGAVVLAHGHLSEVGKIIKIDEEYNDGNDGNYGMNSYYLKGKRVFATREYYEDRTDKKKPMFIERISYYNQKGKVEKTMEKQVEFEEQIEFEAFKPAPLKGIKVDRAKRALDQEGEFSTLFQGFVNAQGINYLVVGGNEKDAFSSAVRIDSEDEFTRLLLMNESECMGKKLQISFKNVTDDTGFEYQSYLQGGFVR